MDKIDEFLPQKKRIISSDDQPFCSQEIKRLKRLKGREFQKHRRSLKWRVLNYEYKRAVIKAKRKYYKDIIKDLKTSKTSQWYSKLKKLCSHDQKKSEPITVESLKHLTVKEQAEAIADKFCKVSLKKLESIKTNKSVPPGDIPPTLAKMFAKEVSSPLCDVINSPIKLGQWSKLYKKESITPVPKVFPPQSPNELRNISGLLLFNKIAEGLIAELMISDISGQLDPSQYANQKGISLQHYMINMINRILSDTDKNSKGEINAVIATLYDWKEAFPRQCPKLGIEAFIKCGVRSSLIPLLISYLQDRTMTVKWNGLTSTERKLNGGGPQGATFGLWEYLVQSNDNSDCVDPDYRFKFVDDLTVLEKVNLLLIGLASFNSHATVPSDIPEHNQFIPAQHLQSQKYLENIQEWTQKQKMILNRKKTKVMIFNFTEKYKFTTRLVLNSETVEVVNKAKLLGVIITDDLKWEENTKYLVKKANSRMELLRKVASFTSSIEDKKTIYIQYVRSILEQSCVVWHSSLTQENCEDLERVQKSAIRIILGKSYENYEDGLKKVDLESLEDRRKNLSLKFATKSLKNEKTKPMFPLREKTHKMHARNEEEFKVNFANTKRLKISSIPFMQNELNSEVKIRRTRKPG